MKVHIQPNCEAFRFVNDVEQLLPRDPYAGNQEGDIGQIGFQEPALAFGHEERARVYEQSV